MNSKNIKDTQSYSNFRSNGKDDRQSSNKLDADARLRGSLGTKRANEVIKTFDDLKSRGLI